MSDARLRIVFPLAAALSCAGLGSALAATPTPAEGESIEEAPLKEIVVTATKTGAVALHNVPLAISAFEADMLEKQGMDGISDIALHVPGFTYSANSVWAVNTIRGVGTNNVFAGGDPSVTLHVDGVYYGRPTAANLDFLDVERIEVLRGPQGTLYGRNAIGGNINVVTRDPTSTASGVFKVTAGNYGLIRPEAAVSGPIVDDKLAFSLAGRYSRRDGYIEQLTPGLPDQADEDRSSLRGKLKLTLHDDLSVVLAADWTKVAEFDNYPTVRRSPLLVDDGQNPGFYQTAQDFPHYFEIEQWGTQATIQWQAGDYTLTSITAYRNSDALGDGDLDISLVPVFHTRAFPEQQSQFSQEINLSGRTGRLEFVTGAYYYRENAESFFNANTFFNSQLVTQGIDVPTRSYAVFAQGTYAATERFSLTGGLRYTRDEKSASNIYGSQALNPALPNGGEPPDPLTQAPSTIIYTGSLSKGAVTPRLGLEYQPNRDVLAYASATRGFKSGGYNLLVDPTSASNTEYGPEDLWAYEAGVKTLLRNKLRGSFNVAAFYYDYKGLQVQEFAVFDQGRVSQLVSNAGSARISGVEAELSLDLTRNLTVGATLAHLSAKYDGTYTAVDNFVLDPVTFQPTTFDAKGKRLNDAPQWTGTAYAEYERSIGSFVVGLVVNAQYKDEVYYSAVNDIRLGAPSYVLFDAGVRLSRDDQRWELGVDVKNLGAKQYLNGGIFFFSSGGLPGEPRFVRAYVRYAL